MTMPREIRGELRGEDGGEDGPFVEDVGRDGVLRPDERPRGGAAAGDSGGPQGRRRRRGREGDPGAPESAGIRSSIHWTRRSSDRRLPARSASRARGAPCGSDQRRRRERLLEARLAG